jgi:hypothetical protein
MPTKKRPGHSYSVYVGLYADEATKQRVERLEEDFKELGRILAQSFYFGRSQAQAERAFSRACLVAMQNPLAFEVVMQRDSHTIIRVKAER